MLAVMLVGILVVTGFGFLRQGLLPCFEVGSCWQCFILVGALLHYLLTVVKSYREQFIPTATPSFLILSLE